MTVAVYLPIGLSVLLAALARRAVRRTWPPVAARGLAAVAGVAATAYAGCLLMLAATLCDDLPPLSARDGELGLPRPVTGPVAVVAVAVLAWGLWRLVRELWVRGVVRRRLRQAGRPRAAGLVVADWEVPYAVAVPGRPGHVLVTTGMLRALDAGERRAMLAHERSHLAGRHDRVVTCVAAAAAVNPLLAPLREVVAHQVERWADEEAAAALGDRALVARAVAKAALAGRVPRAALGVTGADVLDRVRALGRPAPVGRWSSLAGPHGVAAAILAMTAIAAAEFTAVAATWLR